MSRERGRFGGRHFHVGSIIVGPSEHHRRCNGALPGGRSIAGVAMEYHRCFKGWSPQRRCCNLVYNPRAHRRCCHGRCMASLPGVLLRGVRRRGCCNLRAATGAPSRLAAALAGVTRATRGCFFGGWRRCGETCARRDGTDGVVRHQEIKRPKSVVLRQINGWPGG